ncbi:hypothetical protein L228DRAFT_238492 [Xylona heveae TC161]|uniref:WHIM1 domain-containing protein n=1 Tax=Xylona heveae (strain CBS 132557 / TC161) TaxID=1328760 RepID=A0A165GSP7_XYLHT|nr:hypothetical protein L228DRAFT_238492 [Xylona heveae TC161]KZF22547.1 hypothetical protein L228DRAFT_238492 [Xylona heveae TC161]
MSLSDSSALSSAPPSEDELSLPSDDERRLSSSSSNNVKRASSPLESPPPQRKREPSPPHEYVLADNPDIAFLVMFRSRFNEAFPKNLSHFGPQDIERGVVDSVPSPQVENLLCALLGLVLNRKKNVERGHHQRALEEALQTQKYQWPRTWNGANPLSGGKTFTAMTPTERLNLLKTLVLWALSSSDAIQTIIKDSYKQARHEDDLNQPLSVQPWGRDGDKRRYWLIEGQDDTSFRLYRESNPALKTNTWWSVAGSIDELKLIAEKLSLEGTQAARRLSDRILAAIPRFEATEEKRKRREYRNARKAQFTRPEPGHSLYEGRTRGKRIKYTFSDEEDDYSDVTSTRRSTRQSGASTPAELSGPVYTASGRQVRSRAGGAYGISALTNERPSNENSARESVDVMDDPEEAIRGSGTRTRRSGLRTEINGQPSLEKREAGYDSMDETEESSGNEWNGEDEDDDDADVNADEDEEEEGDEEDGGENDELMSKGDQSLVVQLKYNKSEPDADFAKPSIPVSAPLKQPPGSAEEKESRNGQVQAPAKEESFTAMPLEPNHTPLATAAARSELKSEEPISTTTALNHLPSSNTT